MVIFRNEKFRQPASQCRLSIAVIFMPSFPFGHGPLRPPRHFNVCNDTVRGGHRSRDPTGYFILDCQQVPRIEITVEVVGPHVHSSEHIDELRGHTQRIPGDSDAALEDVIDFEVLAKLREIYGAIAISEGGVASQHEQPGETRELRDDLFAESVTNVAAGLVTTHVVECHHRDGRPAWQSERSGGQHVLVGCGLWLAFPFPIVRTGLLRPVPR